MSKLIIAIAFFVTMSLSYAEAQTGRFSTGLQFASNWYKNGFSTRFDYRFTQRLRLSVDGAYYFTSANTVDVYEGITKMRSVNDGRLWDCNANLNILFGKSDFRFYLITGVGFAHGYWLSSMFDALFRTNVIRDEEGNEIGNGFTEEQIVDRTHNQMVLNGGCGIEWQITPYLRWHFEQSLSLGFPYLSTWLCRTGITYCFQAANRKQTFMQKYDR